jgi:catechol 2,3-dioxygenase-like lactoylglutathione lyase family enzyme
MSLSKYEVGAVMATADIKKAREFYEGKLGLKPGSEPEQEEVPVMYECGKGTAISVYLSPDHAGKSTATMASWLVEDLEKVVDELTAAGVAFERYDESTGPAATNEKGIIEFEGGGGVAFFRDPDGNTHAVNQA